MFKTLMNLLSAASGSVPRISVEEAQRLVSEENAVIVDVRDGPEVESSGKAAGAYHISRGMLEFRADPSSEHYNPELRKDRPIVLYCASGARSALAGKLLQDMGFEKVYNLGGLKDWIAAGGKIERPLDSGM